MLLSEGDVIDYTTQVEQLTPLAAPVTQPGVGSRKLNVSQMPAVLPASTSATSLTLSEVSGCSSQNVGVFKGWEQLSDLQRARRKELVKVAVQAAQAVTGTLVMDLTFVNASMDVTTLMKDMFISVLRAVPAEILRKQ